MLFDQGIIKGVPRDLRKGFFYEGKEDKRDRAVIDGRVIRFTFQNFLKQSTDELEYRKNYEFVTDMGGVLGVELLHANLDIPEFLRRMGDLKGVGVDVLKEEEEVKREQQAAQAQQQAVQVQQPQQAASPVQRIPQVVRNRQTR